ncbi:MAG TPA: hypothetical protein VN476_03970 [Pyrinomonadaceae bacterium]|nr:hypothetical protein [Pyrinomonadaceae bacterium]
MSSQLIQSSAPLESIFNPGAAPRPTGDKIVTDRHPRFVFSAGQPLYLSGDAWKHGLGTIPRSIITKIDPFYTQIMRPPQESPPPGTGMDNGLIPDTREPRGIAEDVLNNSYFGVSSLDALVGESPYDTAQILTIVFPRLLPTAPAELIPDTHRKLGDVIAECKDSIRQLESRLRPIAGRCVESIDWARNKAHEWQNFWINKRESERSEASRAGGKPGNINYGEDENMYYAWLDRAKPEIRIAQQNAGAQAQLLEQLLNVVKDGRQPDEMVTILAQDNSELRRKYDETQAQLAELLKRLPPIVVETAPETPKKAK